MAANDPKPIPALSQKELARFWSNVRVGLPDECWDWIGCVERPSKPYGIFPLQGRNLRASRVSYFLAYGQPSGMTCHSCDRPRCVNPTHLFSGTHADNMADMTRKDRQARGNRHGSRKHPESWARGMNHGAHTHPEATCKGEQHGNAKLTETVVLKIRELYPESGLSTRALARRFGVSQPTIRRVIYRETWKHI